ncbi:PREDICTED: uncharacterized protein LOC108780100 [Cyphomyrmex costatus]|uniref:uncharacterized protein LOC108780100 n=1 Tax=Cyphomyrmex costatus TaxID=456900 RepID=UPI0008522F37|nr:PREDICTED: uncharacterized protein LOC108780100 [Cyphomyrmex costatus]
MYRQISVHASQTCLQRILWREHYSADIDTYELPTVTYGTASASFLATMCLRYLAEQHSAQFPHGSACVIRDFYVDDMLTGADTIAELKSIRDETIHLLKLGAFELSKWATNCPDLLGVSNHECKPIAIDHNSADSRILGMQWNQYLDTFQFLCNTESEPQIVSKRIILSDHAKLFDPLGLLGPVIVVAKLILQDLWQLSIQWDESVPPNICTRWVAFKAQLGALNHLKIPRYIKPDAHQFVQVHGFCDASERAFGAYIYIRTQFGCNEYHSELLCSKSRVAPLKAVSLPRLELSAALLLARLIAKVRESLDISNCQTYLWSDSTIALNWITSSSRRWSVFVANRVGEIQRLTDTKH